MSPNKSRVPFFLFAFNRVSGLDSWLAFVKRSTLPVEPILVDNGSTWAPFIDRKNQLPIRKIDVHLPGGPRQLWKHPEFRALASDGFFLADGDLDYASTPGDALAHLKEIAANFPEYVKIGMSLTLSDLPIDAISDVIRKYESQYWDARLRSLGFVAGVDTTVAYYPALGEAFSLFPALRTAPPYSVSHIPWYARQPLTDEEVHYRSVASKRMPNSTFNMDGYGRGTPSHRFLIARKSLQRYMALSSRFRLAPRRTGQLLGLIMGKPKDSASN